MTPSSVPRRAGQRLSRRLIAGVGVGALAFASLASAAWADDGGDFDSGLVINGSFEQGATGWSASGGRFELSDDAYEGDKSGSLTERTQFYHGLQGTFSEPLAHDGEYRLSAKVKFDGQGTSPLAVAYCQAGSSCVQAKDAVKQITAGEWADYTLDFVPKDSPHYKTDSSDHSADVFTRFQFETPWDSTTSFKVDNVKVERTDLPEGLLPEGTFEAGSFEGWQLATGRTGTLSIVEDGAASEHGLKITDRGSTNAGPAADISGKLIEGATYQLKADVKYTGEDASKGMSFTICDPDFTYQVCQNAVKKTVTQNEWTSFEGSFVATVAKEGSSVDDWKWAFFETDWVSDADATAGDKGDFIIDNVSLVKTKDPEPEPEEPDVNLLENVQTKPIGHGNPLVGHKFGADPHQLIFNGRLYIYSTNDTQQYEANNKDENGLPTQSNGYGAIRTLNVMSTDDMVNWVDHGSVAVAGAEGNAPFANNSWAPAAVARDTDGDGIDDEVYLYFCNGGSGTGVMVGESPLGPWDKERGRMIIGSGNPPGYSFPSGMWLFDPEVFVDDDGQPYLYFGGNNIIGTGPENGRQGPQHPKSTRVVKLDKNDWTKLEEPDGSGIITIDAPGMFEASSMVKHKDKYYYSYSSNFSVKQATPEIREIYPNYTGEYPKTGAIAYMVGDSPVDFEDPNNYAGVAFENQSKFFGAGNGGNNHSSMFTYKGKTYLTYHAQTVGSAWAQAILGDAGKTQGYRSVHIDEMAFDEANSRIIPVEGTREGVAQVEDFDPYRQFEAETLAWQLGIRTAPLDTTSVEFPEHGAVGNMVLTNIDNGDWAALRGVQFGDGATQVTARVKALSEGSQIEVRLDDVEGPLVATIDVDSALGEWADVSADVSGASGKHDVFFVFKGVDEGRLVEVDTWEFSGADEPGLVEVTPVAPTIKDNVVTIPVVEGVIYQGPSGNVLSGSITLEAGQNLVVSAVPAEGYKFTDGSATSWEFTGEGSEPGLVEVTPVAPTIKDNVVTIPVVEGVIYQGPSGNVLSGSITLEAGQNLVVSAVPAEGYKFTDGSATSWEFTGEGSEPGLVEVTPVAPTIKDNVVTIPVVEGVIYHDADGKALSGSITLEAGQKLVVKAAPTEGYKFTDGSATSWEFVGAKTAAPDTKKPEELSKTGAAIGTALLAALALAAIGGTAVYIRKRRIQ